MISTDIFECIPSSINAIAELALNNNQLMLLLLKSDVKMVCFSRQYIKTEMGIFNCNFRFKNNYKDKYSKTIQSIILQCHCVKQLQLKSSVSSTKTKNKACVSVCFKNH